MDAAPRNRISDLYHRALERAPEERAAFLADACKGDPELQREIEALLAYQPDAESFLESAPRRAADAGPRAGNAMPSREFGPYTIVAPLGVGGMGEVYRARDNKLQRDVAIKILPPRFMDDRERRARFEREARVLATLNHPNIGAIYGLEESDGVTALVLELVEGPTLADRLVRGKLPLPQAIGIARKIASALDAAHQKNIVHRDLKPANVVLHGAGAGPGSTGELLAKVLDFGLAKITTRDNADGAPQIASTIARTGAGSFVGTPAYMSPEQARGEDVDKRTDIWSFGCVLFEMLSGCRPFDGATLSDTIARVLEREPEWTMLPAETPEALRTLVERCLRKDPDKRLHDIADARIELDELQIRGNQSEARLGAADERRPSRALWVAAAMVAGAALAAGGLAVWTPRTVPVPADSIEFTIAPPPRALFPVQRAHFALAPDGRHIVLVARSGNVEALWIRPIGSNVARMLPDTQGALNPFWSPDSRQVAFFAGGKLKSIAIDGGAASDLCDATMGSAGQAGSDGAWSRDGIILFRSTSGVLQKVLATHNVATPVTALSDGETLHSWPSFLPDGQHFLFLATGSGPPQLRVGSLTSPSSIPLGNIRSNAVYAAGHLLFVSGGLMAHPFDPDSRQLKGEPILLNDAVGFQTFGRGAFSVSDNGLLAFAFPPTADLQLTWLNRDGKPLAKVGEPGFITNLSLSSDGEFLAASSRLDIWVFNLRRGGNAQRLTVDPAGEFDPAWSPTIDL